MRARARGSRITGPGAEFPPDAAVQLVGVGKVFGPVLVASVADAEDPDDIIDEDDEFGDDDEQQATAGDRARRRHLHDRRGTFLGVAGADAAGKRRSSG